MEMEPRFLSEPTSPDVGYDLLVGFLNEAGGINTFAVDVVADDKAPGHRVAMPAGRFDRLAKSNTPGLLLAIDVKANHIYFAWLTPELAHGAVKVVHIAVRQLDDAARAELRRAFTAPPASRTTQPLSSGSRRPARRVRHGVAAES
jgi:hypothetical protein